MIVLLWLKCTFLKPTLLQETWENLHSAFVGTPWAKQTLNILVGGFLSDHGLLFDSTWNYIKFTRLGGWDIQLHKIWCLGILNMSGLNCELKHLGGLRKVCMCGK